MSLGSGGDTTCLTVDRGNMFVNNNLPVISLKCRANFQLSLANLSKKANLVVIICLKETKGVF